MIIVDRIEGTMAVVYNDDVREDIPISVLPVGVKEGDVLLKKEDGFVVDPEATSKLKEENSSLEDELFG